MTRGACHAAEARRKCRARTRARGALVGPLDPLLFDLDLGVDDVLAPVSRDSEDDRVLEHSGAAVGGPGGYRPAPGNEEVVGGERGEIEVDAGLGLGRVPADFFEPFLPTKTGSGCASTTPFVTVIVTCLSFPTLLPPGCAPPDDFGLRFTVAHR